MVAAAEQVERIAGALERLREIADRRGEAPDRPRAAKAVQTNYTAWWAQRHFHRPRGARLHRPKNRVARILLQEHSRKRILVAGRQSGKTQAAAAELLRIMLWEPGSFSALLAPTYKIARAAIDKVRELCEQNLPPGSWTWKQQEKQLVLANGSTWSVFSADRKETVRGPTINGLLWIDEGAFLHVDAWHAASGALVGNKTARIVITTTPAGKNWVHKLFVKESWDSFRFRSTDSPYADHEFIEELRESITAEKFAQEFEAIFVDNLLLAFPPEIVNRLWVDRFTPHDQPDRNVIGVDVGEDHDWCVAVLCNQHGEATILDRWQKIGWPTTIERIKALARQHDALVCVDDALQGKVVVGFLERDKVPILKVNTGRAGTKAKIVEQTRADAQWGRLEIKNGPLKDQFVDELTKFQGIKRVYHGNEVMVYEGPQGRDQHDDCVIALCLANWGRHNDERTPKKKRPKLSKFSAKGGTARSGPTDAGYIFGRDREVRRAA